MRSEPDSNRCKGFCRPVPSHSAIRPLRDAKVSEINETRNKKTNNFILIEIPSFNGNSCNIVIAMTTIKKGDTAPGFSLVDSNRQEVKLSDFQGQNVVILFFPLAFTSTCTTELCAVRDDIAFYQDLDAKVLAISVDTPMTLGKFKSEQNLNIPLLSDFNKDVSVSYGCLYETFILNMKGVSKRSAFIVDKKGIIHYAEVLEKSSEIPNFDAIKAILTQLA